LQEQDLRERFEPRPAERPLDVISEAVGTGIFIRSHRTALQLDLGNGFRGRRLSVSRYYWGAEPPVAVDFRKEVQHGRPEVEAKAAYFAGAGVRYVLAVDEWDEEALSLALAPSAAEAEPGEPQRPLVAPRRKPAR
jgi:hypothetical protein